MELRYRTQIDCRRLYTDAISEEHINKLEKYIEELKEDEYKVFASYLERFSYNKKYLGWKKYRITNNAIDLMLKIQADCDYKVFPYIETVAAKGWSISDGTFAWSMYRLDAVETYINSDFRVRDCLKKQYKLEWYVGSTGEIMIQPIKV